MGENCSTTMSRSLFLFAMLIAAVSGQTVYTSFYSGAANCDGTATFSLATVQDVCSCYGTSAGAACIGYQKVTLSGSTYTWGLYASSDTTCASTAAGTATGTDGQCLDWTSFKVAIRTTTAATTATLTCSATSCTAAAGNSAGTLSVNIFAGLLTLGLGFFLN